MPEPISQEVVEGSSQAWPRVLLLLILGILIAIVITKREQLQQWDRERLKMQLRDVIEQPVQRPGARIRESVESAISDSVADVRPPTRPR